MSEPTTIRGKWRTASLDELFTILDSERVPVNATERANRLGETPYYGATGQVGWIDDFLFDQELVLLGEDGAPFLEPDKSKAYVVKGRTWVNNHAHVLRVLGRMPSLLWKYQLDQVDYRPFVSGTTRLKLPQAAMRRIRLLVPPLPEQYRIVEAIESYFTRLDDAVATLERVEGNLKRYRASVLKAAVEGRLVPTEAELARTECRDYEPASVLLERILIQRRRCWESSGRKGKYKEPAALDAANLPALPEGWCWARLSALADVQLGQQRHPDHANAERQVPYIRAANITWDGLDLFDVKTMGFENPKRYSLEDGDIVLSEASGSPMEAGKPAIWRDEIPGACYQKTVLRVRPFDKAAWLPAFAHAVFMRDCKTGKFANAAPGVGIVHLTAERMLDWAVPVAPVSEQTRIAVELDRLLSQSNASEDAVGLQVTRCARLRQSILKWAFEGELVDQDPNDEPASVLLERIKAERAAAASPKKDRRIANGRAKKTA
jgi:type I restriction enzyme, S subunit